MIGLEFKKYKADPFIFTNSVTMYVGLYIGDNVYEIKNEQQVVDYYGITDDMAVWNVTKKTCDDIQSAFVNTEQIDTPVNETIHSITLVEENQIVTDNKDFNYNVWLTRAIIIHISSRDICFEKDDCAFSEQIEITRGHDLKNNYPKTNTFFLEDWAQGIEPSVKQRLIEIK